MLGISRIPVLEEIARAFSDIGHDAGALEHDFDREVESINARSLLVEFLRAPADEAGHNLVPPFREVEAFRRFLESVVRYAHSVCLRGSGDTNIALLVRQ
jgi:hypothetical protein